MRRRQALRTGTALATSGLATIAGCAGVGTNPTAPIKINNDTTSEVFVRVNTEILDGDFWREVEIIIPNNGVENDPWFKEMFVDEGDYRVHIETATQSTETRVTHPSSD